MTNPNTSIPQALVDIRQKGALAVCVVLWGIVVQIALIGFVLGSPSTYVTVAAAILASVVSLEYRRNPTGQSVQLSSAAALAVGIGLVVYQYADHPWQVDNHMQFFAGLAVLAIYCNWRVIGFYTGLVAAHHLGLGLILPSAVMPGDVSLGRILLHAAVLLVEAAILIVIAEVIVKAFYASDAATRDARQAQQKAEDMRIEQARADAEVAKLKLQEDLKKERVVRDLEAGLLRLSEGNLVTAIESPADDPFPTEYESIRITFNEVASQLASTMSRIIDIAGQVRGGSEEITSASQDLARRAETQAATLEQSAAALHELTESVRSTAGLAKDAQKSTNENKISAEQGAVIVQRAISAMQQIERSSEQINRIIGVIDDIAFQTSLLALNAGVEAARAGETGRGFTVVASEVRALAQRASESASAIKTLILESTQHVQEGSLLVLQTGGSLEQILAKAKTVAEQASLISVAASDQATALSEINSGVVQLDLVTQQNAAVAEECNAAAASLRQQSGILTDELSSFSIDQSSQSSASPLVRPLAKSSAVVRRLQPASEPVESVRSPGRSRLLEF